MTEREPALNEAERLFLESLPEHLGGVRLRRLVRLHDQLAADLKRLGETLHLRNVPEEPPLTPEERAELEEMEEHPIVLRLLRAHDQAVDQTWREGTRADEAEEVANAARTDAYELGKQLRKLRESLDELVDWASPLSKDLGDHGLLNTIRRTMEDERAELTRLRAQLERFAGPRCECCGDQCIDLAKDENGLCPDCSEIDLAVARGRLLEVLWRRANPWRLLEDLVPQVRS